MKRQIFPVLILSLVLPWIVSRVFQTEGHRDTIRQNKREWIRQESFSGCDIKASAQPVSYGELSTKQINYLIP